MYDEMKKWVPRALRHGSQTKWTNIKSKEKQEYRRNAYRVLLTRARKGMVIYVPRGDGNDPTQSPALFDATSIFLLTCGVLSLDT